MKSKESKRPKIKKGGHITGFIAIGNGEKCPYCDKIINEDPFGHLIAKHKKQTMAKLFPEENKKYVCLCVEKGHKSLNDCNRKKGCYRSWNNNGELKFCPKDGLCNKCSVPQKAVQKGCGKIYKKNNRSRQCSDDMNGEFLCPECRNQSPHGLNNSEVLRNAGSNEKSMNVDNPTDTSLSEPIKYSVEGVYVTEEQFRAVEETVKYANKEARKQAIEEVFKELDFGEAENIRELFADGMIRLDKNYSKDDIQNNLRDALIRLDGWIFSNKELKAKLLGARK